MKQHHDSGWYKVTPAQTLRPNTSKFGQTYLSSDLLKMTSANARYTVNSNKNARAVLMAFLLNKLELEIAHS